MTPQQVIGVALRLIALWCAISSVRYFVSGTSWAPGEMPGVDTTVFGWGMMAAGIVFGVAALVLWTLPMMIAALLLPRTRHANDLQIPGFELARVGCALIGLWLCVQTLTPLIWSFLRALLATTNSSVMGAMPAEMKLELGMYVLNLALGGLLVGRAGRFGELVARQPSGSPRPADAPDEAPSTTA